ncbi:MAG TPA: LytTR family DNA-binding domain-containing protein [Pyrinomonadaceae bacterium]|nr:LytTR family DNA-binding domain-containing protein [Pyrinomonadaceae bacterium]
MNHPQQIRAIIADDEPLARRGVRQLLGPHPDIAIVAEARNGRETVLKLREFKPDLLFLDVQMPELDGFDVLREIGARHMPAVIFVTAHDEFAVRAFDAHALDYLVKPLEVMRFAKALERMRDRLSSARAVDLSRKLSALLAMRDEEKSKRRILVPTSSGDLLLDAEEIDWIEADDYYAAIYAREGRHLIRESLASLEQRLDSARFVRVHRSAIVNVDRVRELRNKAGETSLILRTGVNVPVSRRRRARVIGQLRHLKT